MIDQELIDTLYATRTGKNSPRSLGKVFQRGENGELASFTGIAKMGDHDFGSFQGKVGSVRRSAKGRTRRMPNGRRKHEFGWWLDDRVLAYKLKPR